MAAQARKAAQDAGVAALVDVLDDRAEQLLDGLAPVAGDLQEVMDVLADLRDGLHQQVTDADRARTEADQARLDAEDRARQARHGQRAPRPTPPTPGSAPATPRPAPGGPSRTPTSASA